MIEIGTRLGLPILGFADAPAFGNFLANPPRGPIGLWLRLARKGADMPSPTKAGAIDVALCHGWIDGQQHPFDEISWLTRFTPRRPASRWSQVNRARALELNAAGRMQPAGLAEIEAAMREGRWNAAYAPAGTAEPCPKFRAALDAAPRAAAAFDALNRAERYAMLHRIANLRTARGRAARVAGCVAALGG